MNKFAAVLLIAAVAAKDAAKDTENKDNKNEE